MGHSEKTSASKATLLGPLLYSDDKSADALFQQVRNRYPSLIGIWIDSLYQEKSYTEKCFLSIRGLFETLNQIVGLICASIYLQNQSNEAEDSVLLKSIHDQFARLSMPSTGAWIHLTVKILSFYQDSSRRNTFPIPKLLDDIQSVLIPEEGYNYVLYKGINNVVGQDKSYFDGRVLFAGLNLRNIIHHDKIRDSRGFEHIYPFYRDILLRTLTAFEFLDRDYFRLVRVNRDQRKIDELHGRIENSQPIRPTHSLYEHPDESVLYLYDVERNRYIPLHPFFLQISNYWEKQREFMLASLSEQQAWFIGRNGLYRIHEKSFTQIQRMLEAKQVRLATIDWNRLEPTRFIQLALELTRGTLDTYQRRGKYLSGAYLRRESLEIEIQQFFISKDKLAMIVWGEGGMGKSALLCDIAYRYLPDSEQWTNENIPTVLPIFLNAGTIRLTPALVGLLEALKKNFMIQENYSLQKIEDFFDKIDALINQHKENMPKQVLFIIDAINESDSSNKFFMELYNLVKLCTDSNGQIRYPWLKIIYSTRPVNYQKETKFGRQLSGLLPDDSLFYRTSTEADTVFENWQVMPYLNIPPYKLEEITEAFRLYALNDQFTYLNHFDVLTLERKITPYQAVLIQPLLLRFFTDILNSNEGVDLPLGLDGYNLFREYYHHLTGSSGTANGNVAECLDHICYKMISKDRNFLLSSELIEIRHFFDKKEQTIVWYINPVEELIHHRNVLSELLRILKSKDGQPIQVVQAYQFTYQKFGEYTFAQYFERCYGPVTPDIFYKRLTITCTLTEYNKGLVWYGAPLWKSGRLKELFNWSVPELSERYCSVLIDLMLEEWVDLLLRKTTEQVLTVQVTNWCQIMKEHVFYENNPLIQEPNFAIIFYEKIATVMKDWAELKLAYDFIMEQLRILFDELPIDEISAFFWLDEANRTVEAGLLSKAVKLYQQVQTALLSLPIQLESELVANRQVLIFHTHKALGQLYQRMHRFDVAQQELEQADNLATELYHRPESSEGQRALKALALGNLSAYFNEQFDLDQALHYNQEQLLVLELLTSSEYLPEKADGYYKRAILFGLLNNSKEQAACLSSMRLAIDRALLVLPRSKRLHKLDRLFHLLIAQTDEGIKAKESLQQAEEFFRQAGGMNTKTIEWLEYGALLAEVKGNRVDSAFEAIACFEQAIKCWKEAESLMPGDWSVVLRRIGAHGQLALAYRNAGFFLDASSLHIEVKNLLQRAENEQALSMTAKVELLQVYLRLCSSMIFMAGTEKDVTDIPVDKWLDQLIIKSGKLLNELLDAMPSKNHLLMLQAGHMSTKAFLIYHRRKNEMALQLTLEAIEQMKVLYDKTNPYWLAEALAENHYIAGMIYSERFLPRDAEEAELFSLQAGNHLLEGVIKLLEHYEASKPDVSENAIGLLIHSLLALSAHNQKTGKLEKAEKDITLALSIIPSADLGIHYETRTRWRMECTLAMADLYTYNNDEKAIEYYQQAIDEQKRLMEGLFWSYEQALWLGAVYGKLLTFMRECHRKNEVLDFCDQEYTWIKNSFLMQPRPSRKRRNFLAWITHFMSDKKRIHEFLYMTLELHRDLALEDISLRKTSMFIFIIRAFFCKIFRLNRYR